MRQKAAARLAFATFATCLPKIPPPALNSTTRPKARCCWCWARGRRPGSRTRRFGAALTAQLNELSGLRGAAGTASGEKSTGRWSLGQLEKLDHLGAQVLWNHWGRSWPAQLQLEPGQRALLETVAQFTCDPPKAAKADWTEPLVVWGQAGV